MTSQVDGDGQPCDVRRLHLDVDRERGGPAAEALRADAETVDALQQIAFELDEIGPRLLEHVPEYLRRNLKGRTPAELIFHIFLAMLHDEGNIDDPNLPTQATRRAATPLRCDRRPRASRPARAVR